MHNFWLIFQTFSLEMLSQSHQQKHIQLQALMRFICDEFSRVFRFHADDSEFYVQVACMKVQWTPAASLRDSSCESTGIFSLAENRFLWKASQRNDHKNERKNAPTCLFLLSSCLFLRNDYVAHNSRVSFQVFHFYFALHVCFKAVKTDPSRKHIFHWFPSSPTVQRRADRMV